MKNKDYEDVSQITVVYAILFYMEFSVLLFFFAISGSLPILY
jgi:hypothetical protein